MQLLGGRVGKAAPLGPAFIDLAERHGLAMDGDTAPSRGRKSLTHQPNSIASSTSAPALSLSPGPGDDNLELAPILGKRLGPARNKGGVRASSEGRNSTHPVPHDFERPSATLPYQRTKFASQPGPPPIGPGGAYHNLQPLNTTDAFSVLGMQSSYNPPHRSSATQLHHSSATQLPDLRTHSSLTLTTSSTPAYHPGPPRPPSPSSPSPDPYTRGGGPESPNPRKNPRAHRGSIPLQPNKIQARNSLPVGAGNSGMKAGGLLAGLGAEGSGELPAPRSSVPVTLPSINEKVGSRQYRRLSGS
eukprot:gene9615-7530_t